MQPCRINGASNGGGLKSERMFRRKQANARQIHHNQVSNPISVRDAKQIEEPRKSGSEYPRNRGLLSHRGANQRAGTSLRGGAA